MLCLPPCGDYLIRSHTLRIPFRFGERSISEANIQLVKPRQFDIKLDLVVPVAK